jgi:hypothetical protein
MQWVWKMKGPRELNWEELDKIIHTTITQYGVTCPCERAWFAMALHKILPVLIKEGKVT